MSMQTSITRGSAALLVVLVASLPCCVSHQPSAPAVYIFAPLDASPGEAFVFADAKDEKPKENPNWPKGFQLDIEFTLANVKSAKYRRPYVAVWIENADAKGKAVRFLFVWGKEIKYQTTLRNFYPLAKFNGVVVDAVTRPTRPPGLHTVTWDGLDDAGKPVPAGSYIVHVEVSREHGTRQHMTAAIACKDEAAEAKMEGNVEVTGVVVRFGSKK